MKQRRALILYATMTKNTEKVANWFQETFGILQLGGPDDPFEGKNGLD